VGATGVVENSIVNNLPVSQTASKVSCTYSALKITCKNVGSFVEPVSHEYFISFKALFSANSATDLGKISIKSIVYNADGSLLTVTNLFQDSAAAATPTFYSQLNTYDDTGFHNSAGSFRMGTTQVVSAYDDGSVQATTNAIKV
jgi:hypothetical protein